MLDDMISNAIDNYDHPRKHVTYDDRMAHVDVWHSFIDWALYYSGLPGGKIILLLVWITTLKVKLKYQHSKYSEFILNQGTITNKG